MATNYKAYPAYKDSGVEWLGEIPEGWISTELKRFSYVRGGYAFNSEQFKDNGTPLIRIGDIKADGNISIDSCKFISNDNLTQYKPYFIQNGDILMAMTGATIGKVGLYTNKEIALLNQRVGSFKNNSFFLNNKFFWYVLNSDGYQSYIRLTAFGGAQPNISDTAMVAYPSAYPSLDEQQKIADFLDYETAKIDTLINKQEKLIELLKEKRQAVISHAVTKGLDPNVPMKDSGVEWLGEVPESWALGSLRWRISIASGESLSSSRVEKNKDKINIIPVIGGNGIMGYSNSINTNKTVFAIGRVGALCGNVHLINYPCWITDNALKISQWNGFNEEYLTALLKVANLNDLASKTAQPLITGEQIKSLYVVIPPLNIQTIITNYLKNIELNFDKLKYQCTKSIELLKERKTALISAAVTGKIDMRDWQKPKDNN